VNAAALLETTLDARALLDGLLGIERGFGRERRERWGPRTLDLDLLLYGDACIDEPGLHVPHPHLHERAFALRPLADVAPDARVPGQGRVADLLARVDASACVPLDAAS
ncbi:MAG: 2-amino-4-hydroxy-6-hydroxymethyldihydropteridine diphosphokinase, partial [Lysobacteraceae bacterium]